MPPALFAKLFISVLVMSDTGSVATTALTTDLPMEQCLAISVRDFNRKQDITLNNHVATIIVKSYCEPLREPPFVVAPPVPIIRGQMPPQGIPPPVANILRGFLGDLQ